LVDWNLTKRHLFHIFEGKDSVPICRKYKKILVELEFHGTINLGEILEISTKVQLIFP
jgi:hypothetical protein